MLINAHGQVAWQVSPKIDTSCLRATQPFSPIHQLHGAEVDWNAEPRLRCPGDALHYPGTLHDGRRVWVSHALTFYAAK